MSFRFDLKETEIAGALLLDEVRHALVGAFIDRRNSCGLRQSHVADQIGVHRSVINRELNGEQNLTVSRVGELAEAMGQYVTFELTPKEHVDGENIRQQFVPARKHKFINVAANEYCGDKVAWK